jgi:hypothetical protein
MRMYLGALEGQRPPTQAGLGLVVRHRLGLKLRQERVPHLGLSINVSVSHLPNHLPLVHGPLTQRHARTKCVSHLAADLAPKVRRHRVELVPPDAGLVRGLCEEAMHQ